MLMLSRPATRLVPHLITRQIGPSTRLPALSSLIYRPQQRRFCVTTLKMAIAAVGQICSTSSMTHNLDQCVKLLSKAAEAGAKVLFLPEASDYIASSPQESLSLAKTESDSPFVQGLQVAARQHGIHVHVGIHVPIPVKPSSPPTDNDTCTTTTTTTTTTKLLNRTIWILPTGEIDPTRNYDKLHLFDYANLRESAHTQAGTSLTRPFDTPVGRIGSLICFDLRFP
ncbi:putative hydrolase nit2, partial [Cytospora mali]